MTTISRAHADMARYQVNAEEPSDVSGLLAKQSDDLAGMAKEHVPGHEETATPSTRMDRIAQGVAARQYREQLQTTNGILQAQGLDVALAGHDASYREAMAAPIDPRDLCSVAAHHTAVAQAYQKEVVHVGLLGALDLPGGYKNVRANDFSVPPGSDAAANVTAKLKADPQAMARLQAKADLGMAAARDMIPTLERTGMSREDFFASRPEVARAYAEDPAFREGFDAYVYAANHAKQELPAINARLDHEAIEDHRALAYLSLPA